MRCWNCDTINDEDANRCDNCGLRPLPPGSLPNLSAGFPLRGRLAAAFFALLTGVLGLHKFYLGYTVQGLILIVATFASMILMPVTPYAAIIKLVVMLIGITEGVLYLLQSDERFIETYVVKRRAWF